MPGSKGLNPHELAHKWMKDLGTRPNMSCIWGINYKSKNEFNDIGGLFL